jgi:pentatricopeptide repeat protein
MRVMLQGSAKPLDAAELPSTSLAFGVARKVGLIQYADADVATIAGRPLMLPPGLVCSATVDATIKSAGAQTWLKQMLVQLPEQGGQSMSERQSTLVTIFCHAEDLEGAETCLRGFLDTPDPESSHLLVAFRGVIHLCCRLHKTENAVHWFRELMVRDIVPSQSIFQAMVGAFAEVGSFAELEKHFFLMKEHSVLNTDEFWQAMLKACARCREVERASELFDHILASGHIFNTTTFNTIIHTCSQVGDLERAERYFFMMEKLGFEPCLTSYNGMINACACKGDIEKAERWLNKMVASSVKPNEITYGTLCKAFARRGEPYQVKRILQAYSSHGNQLNEYFFAAWISACGQASPADLKGAEDAFWEVVRHGLRPQRIRRVLARVLGDDHVAQLMSQHAATTNAAKVNGTAKESGKKSKAAKSKHSAASIVSSLQPQGALKRAPKGMRKESTASNTVVGRMQV